MDDHQSESGTAVQTMVKEPARSLSVKEFLSVEYARESREMRKRALAFLFAAYGFLLVATVTVVFLQGFNAWGFDLESGFLNWLGAATI